MSSLRLSRKLKISSRAILSLGFRRATKGYKDWRKRLGAQLRPPMAQFIEDLAAVLTNHLHEHLPDLYTIGKSRFVTDMALTITHTLILTDLRPVMTEALHNLEDQLFIHAERCLPVTWISNVLWLSLDALIKTIDMPASEDVNVASQSPGDFGSGSSTPTGNTSHHTAPQDFQPSAVDLSHCTSLVPSQPSLKAHLSPGARLTSSQPSPHVQPTAFPYRWPTMMPIGGRVGAVSFGTSTGPQSVKPSDVLLAHSPLPRSFSATPQSPIQTGLFSTSAATVAPLSWFGSTATTTVTPELPTIPGEAKLGESSSPPNSETSDLLC
ncbi:hypothetical protein CPB85DRAFT_1253927 [Mucidula mucida]|nr:hypothetical protein CPB85DRAFT_1253927 [Mucidula mucida]